MTFEQFGLIEPILNAVKTKGYTTPTPIQEQSIPIILSRKDLLGCAQTGTGKTAAFAIPTLQILHSSKGSEKGYKHIRSLILTPTRELAVQINESFAAYGKNTGLKTEVIYGGVSQHTQTIALRNGTDILVATPGRLLDLMNQGYIYLDHLEIFVLDEADRMLDMGFIQDIKKIIRELPQEKQTLFFSATMPPEISRLANSLLNNAEKVEVTPVSTTAEKIEQSVFMVHRNDKQALLEHLLKQNKQQRTLVFTQTKHGADRIAKDLNKANIQADAIHGNKTQVARQRALHNFKTSRLKVLVATDIAARGIDVDNLTHVINFDLPAAPEMYVHRIGRTGRAGAAGIAISFCAREEMGNLRDINRTTAQNIPIQTEHPYRLNAAPMPAYNNGNQQRTSYKPRNNDFNRRRNQPVANG